MINNSNTEPTNDESDTDSDEETDITDNESSQENQEESGKEGEEEGVDLVPDLGEKTQDKLVFEDRVLSQLVSLQALQIAKSITECSIKQQCKSILISDKTHSYFNIQEHFYRLKLKYK